jgi:hypothetical protein
LYELIQNADDSDFSIAKRSNKHPYVHFKVTPSTLVFETNEDGFTRAKIEAICAAETSSKKASASDNYIGEKGFGFKSVFSVAYQVHVQSGLWSLQFKHKQGDDGLGIAVTMACFKQLFYYKKRPSYTFTTYAGLRLPKGATTVEPLPLCGKALPYMTVGARL